MATIRLTAIYYHNVMTVSARRRIEIPEDLQDYFRVKPCDRKTNAYFSVMIAAAADTM